MLKRGLHILLIALLVFGVAVFTGCRQHSYSRKAEFMEDYITEALDLNESQQAQLNQIKEELIDKARQMHANKESMHEELVAQLRSEEIDQVHVKAMIAEHRAQMDEIIDLMVVRLADFHKSLTPEQRDKLVAKIETFKKWHNDHWE
jgi:Spy/CpxP family protein refolding chaperone